MLFMAVTERLFPKCPVKPCRHQRESKGAWKRKSRQPVKVAGFMMVEPRRIELLTSTMPL